MRARREALKLALTTPRQDANRCSAITASELRDDALKLALLEENKLLPEAQNTLLSHLADEAYGQRWLSTQESNALFLAGRTLQISPAAGRRKLRAGRTALRRESANPATVTGDQLAALQVTNTGQQPLVAPSRQQRISAERAAAGGNVLGIERQIFDTQGQQKSLSSLRSGELVLVKLEVTAKRNVPDALVVVDLLRGG